MFVAGIVSKLELWEVATRRVRRACHKVVASATPWLGPTFAPAAHLNPPPPSAHTFTSSTQQQHPWSASYVIGYFIPVFSRYFLNDLHVFRLRFRWMSIIQ
jgi:hypothetical protein